MAKRKSGNIVIYPNRYLIWAVVFVIIVSASLVAYIKITDILFESENVPVSNIKPVSNEDWKIYTNSKYGFSFKYPSEQGKVCQPDNPNSVQINPSCEGREGYPGIRVYVSPNDPNIIAKFETSFKNKKVRNFAQQNIKVDGIDAVEFSGSLTDELGVDLLFKQVIFNYNGHLYDINDYYYIDKSYLDQILSTFKFIN